QGGETPVETHHEASAAHLLNCSLHLGETRTIRGQWFLQEHGLAGPDGVAGQGRMLVVTSRDYYGIHRRVSQHLGWIAGAVRCAVAFRRVLAGESRDGAHTDEPHLAMLQELREQDSLRELARADNPKADRVGALCLGDGGQ